MSDDLTCPVCRTDEHLSGRPVDAGIEVTCEACGASWIRDGRPRCPTCDSTDVVPAAQAVWEKARGTQLSITSVRVVHLCPTCDPDRLRRWASSGTPLPPEENPAEGMR